MERDRLQGLKESEVPYPAGYDLGINPGHERVLDERQDPTHPLRKGRIKPAWEIPQDSVDLKSVKSQDGGE